MKWLRRREMGVYHEGNELKWGFIVISAVVRGGARQDPGRLTAAPRHGTECRDVRGDGRVGVNPQRPAPHLIPRQRVKV